MYLVNKGFFFKYENTQKNEIPMFWCLLFTKFEQISFSSFNKFIISDQLDFNCCNST